MSEEEYDQWFRKQFENWVSEVPRCRRVDRWPTGLYKDMAVQLAWEAWCVQ